MRWCPLCALSRSASRACRWIWRFVLTVARSNRARTFATHFIAGFLGALAWHATVTLAGPVLLLVYLLAAL